jgi:hypothetical protein
MPFRSETEQIREQLRRSEEQASELRAELAELARRVAAATGEPWMWALGGLVVCLLGIVGGFGLGALSQSIRASRARATASSEHAAQQESEAKKGLDCAVDAARAQLDLTKCEQASFEYRPPPAPPPSSCSCAPGDPLCTCPFDRGAASAALLAATSSVTRCIKPQRVAALHVKITFAPRGDVENAVVDFGDGLSSTEKACAELSVRSVKIPAFTGGPVTVGKSYSSVAP